MEENELNKLINSNNILKNLYEEIQTFLKDNKDKEVFSARESKELDIKILEFMELCAKELLKIKDKIIRKNIQKNIYFMRYDFLIKGNYDDLIISEPVNEIFDVFQQKDSPKEIIKIIQLARKDLNDAYVGF